MPHSELMDEFDDGFVDADTAWCAMDSRTAKQNS
jgi:hypothetical protein